MFTSLLVIMFTCVPMLNIDLDTIKYDTTRSKQCGMSVPQPADTGYQPIINSLGGKTAAVPVWWYFDTSDDTAWLGSAYFLNTAGYYNTDHALSPHSAWPYNTSRDAGLADPGAGGYPTCKQWWADDTVGLKARLLQLPAPDIWTAFKKSASHRLYTKRPCCAH